MNNRIKIGVALFLNIVVLIGCGGSSGQSGHAASRIHVNPNSISKKENEPEKPLTPEHRDSPALNLTAQYLNLRIVPDAANGIDPTMPDASIALDSKSNLDSYTIEENVVIVHSKIYLPDASHPNPDRKKEHFFVWPEKISDVSILSAVYSHRARNPKGKWIGSLVPKPVWHDVQGHRWFIPISELFKNIPGYDPAEVNLEDTQHLNLEINLANGKKLVVEIQFQVSGPLPTVPFKDLGPAPFPLNVGVGALVSKISREGWVLFMNEVTNPTSKPFHLWVRHQMTSHQLKLSTHLNFPQYTARQGGLYVLDGPSWNMFTSEGILEISELEIEHGSGRVEKAPLVVNEWVQVKVEPKERVILKWRVTPKAPVIQCSVPLPEVKTYSWTVPTSPGLFQTYTRNEQLDWFIQAWEISGKWTQEVRLTHPFVSPAEATQDSTKITSSNPAEFLTLSHLPITMNFGYGDKGLRAKQTVFHCQGVFP